MIAVLGIIVVLGAIIGGYLLEEGVLGVLYQPAEFLIIFGAALGSLLIGSSQFVLRQIIRNLGSIFHPRHLSKEDYIAILGILDRLFTKIRREGLAAIESDIERPLQSHIFTAGGRISRDTELVLFICDSVRVYLVSGDPYEIDTLMSVDIEVTHTQGMAPALNINRLAESLPGLGIVAAVLGVVLTMGKITQPPEILGHSIGAALVGTFLGVLGCYGFVGPMAANLENQAREREMCLNVVKSAISAAVRGAPPMIAVECGRRSIPSDYRPAFLELENIFKK